MTDVCPFDPVMFHDAAIDPDTANLNAQMIELLTGQPEWWIVGAQAARAARRRGDGPFPAPVFSERARTMTITGKDGNQISLRVIAPAQPRGYICISMVAVGYLAAQTCKIRCWSGSPTT